MVKRAVTVKFFFAADAADAVYGRWCFYRCWRDAEKVTIYFFGLGIALRSKWLCKKEEAGG